MNAFLLVALFTLQPADAVAAAPLETLFRDQRASVIQDIRVGIQADLEQRGAKFFTANGGLRRQLDAAIVVERGLAVR